MYTCVTDGCPDAGAMEMRCKPGFEGPLCALCADGFFQHMRQCNPCAATRYYLLALFIVGVLVLFAIVLRGAYRIRHYLYRMNFFSHFKIIVSFVTLISTMEHQFGVKWPPQFAAALQVLSILSLDLRFISALFCIVKINFWENLLSTTLTLMVVVVIVLGMYFMARGTEAQIREFRRHCLFVVVYFLTFSYPLVSVKIVQAFSCHNIDGRDYLRADYSLACFDPQWQFYAVYSGLFLTVYVMGFPAYIFNNLWRYRSEDMEGGTKVLRDRAHPSNAKRGRQNEDRMLGFLRDDYKNAPWACLWEFEEMVRKLILSVLGAFWSKKVRKGLELAAHIACSSHSLQLT
jgi:hypothetical protein